MKLTQYCVVIYREKERGEHEYEKESSKRNTYASATQSKPGRRCFDSTALVAKAIASVLMVMVFAARCRRGRVVICSCGERIADSSGHFLCASVGWAATSAARPLLSPSRPGW